MSRSPTSAEALNFAEQQAKGGDVLASEASISDYIKAIVLIPFAPFMLIFVCVMKLLRPQIKVWLEDDLKRVGVPAVPINTIDQVFADPKAPRA